MDEWMNESSWNYTIPIRRMNQCIKLELDNSIYKIVIAPKGKNLSYDEMIYVYR